MDCVQTTRGNSGHLDPVAITELNLRGDPHFKPRHYRRTNGNQLASGFGFVFAPTTTRGLHKTRVMILDFSQWRVKHLVHFICKYIYN